MGLEKEPNVLLLRLLFSCYGSILMRNRKGTFSTLIFVSPSSLRCKHGNAKDDKFGNTDLQNQCERWKNYSVYDHEP